MLDMVSCGGGTRESDSGRVTSLSSKEKNRGVEPLTES
jgi:hypothetical protein